MHVSDANRDLPYSPLGIPYTVMTASKFMIVESHTKLLYSTIGR